LRDHISFWRNEDVDVVMIGNGNRDFAEDFRQEFEIDGHLLVDSDLHAYRAAGLRRGRRELASPQLVGNTIRALRSGARQTRVLGDPWQLGGVFVFGPGGELRFQHASAAAGDHASPEDIEAALDPSAEVLEEASSALSIFAPAMNALRPALDASPFFSFDRLGFQRHSIGFDPADTDVDLYGRRCVVGGGFGGVGYEAALALADLGAEVILLCDERAGTGDFEEAAVSIREATGNRNTSIVRIDWTRLSSIDTAVSQLRKSPLDILIHCSEALPDKRVRTEDGFELTFAEHVAGPHRLTRGLAATLEASDDARVIWVSSGTMLTRRLNLDDLDWSERDYDAAVAFAEAKRAQVVLAELWAETFTGTSVQVNSMHPGWVDSPTTRSGIPLLRKLTKPILRNSAEGADTIVWLAASPAVEGRTGRFFFDRQAVRTHWLPTTRESREDRERLWQICEGL
jgi:NAD(P)-dependent dehydrogenase (short-subunit alcohol dehydrogenase family)